jgi:hypothetical protein
MTLRTLLTIWLTFLVAAPVFGQGGIQTPVRLAKPFSLAQVWTLDETYTDLQHGVTFQYPSVWQAELEFGYLPPALTVFDAAKPIAGFGYREGPFPRVSIVGPYSRFNLEGFGIVYAAVPAADAADCEAKASSVSKTPKRGIAVFGGRSFSEYETADGAMTQASQGTLYATYAQSVCYLFEIDVATASAVLDDYPALTPAQWHFIWGHLVNIMKSVRIMPAERKPN